MKIGENIIRIRKEKGLKRSALVRKLRFIYGNNAIDYRTIERIERGDIAKGRLSSLLQLADALDVDISDLYKGTEYEDRAGIEEKLQESYITRAEARGGIFRYNDKAYLEIISPAESAYISFLLRLEPGAKTKLEQDTEGTIKFLYVINGQIKVTVGNLDKTLYKGDSIQINSHKPHYFENRTKQKALAILYQNPKRF
jgi:transcriptional regulator with XRE-family HTH domain